MVNISLSKQNWWGIAVAVAVGVAAMLIKELTQSALLDPLFIALLIGIILRSFVRFDDKFIAGFRLTPMLFIPLGVVLYGAINLDFVKFATVEPMIIFIMIFVFLGNAAVAFFLSYLLGLKPKTTYLITAGSAVCGASAIAVTSKAVDAESDDVSNSLVSVFVTALFGLFFFLPFLAGILKMSGVDFSIMAGSLLQFTGFVKEAVANTPLAGNNAKELMSLALSVKAVRYLGLLILVPLFASFVKRKFYIPWYLWGFLIAGLLFSFLPFLSKTFNPILKPILDYLWSMAMGAIGLNANLKVLLSEAGIKALVVSFVSFIFAVGIFLGLYLPLRELVF